MKDAARSDSEPLASLASSEANIGARAAPRGTLWSWLRLKPLLRLSSGSGRQQPITGVASPYYVAVLS